MSSTADKVNALWNVQMVQRRHLEKLYPYLDWSKMPFSSYNDFFRLKNIIDDCGAVWTNAYRRSNNEAADTRKYLKDYSGNGRDIELYNFAFAGNSGYNGFVENTYLGETWDDINECTDVAYNKDKTKAEVSQIKQAKVIWIFIKSIGSDPVGTKYKLKARIQGLSDYISLGKSIRVNLGDTRNGGLNGITEDGVYETEFVKSETTYGFIGLSISGHGEEDLGACSMTFEQISDYPGALVSDGVDDYGQCVKDFALPDDFTVVAVRKILKTNGDDCLVAKSMEPNHGALIIDYSNKGNIDGGFNGHSYGYIRENPYTKELLFSYLTKTTYNGMSITVGSRPDTDADKVTIFTKRKNTDGTYMSAALHSFGIFTRTLTEDELRIVKNCMMAEYIAMTGILDNVEYYDILDARFRSNDEDADKRNKWTGRFGKLHMTLNNYALSKMSGWNGSYINFIGFWSCDQRSSGLTDTKDGEYKVIFTNVDKIPAKGINYYHKISTSSTIRVKARVSGLMLSETFSLSYRNQEDTLWIKLTDGTGDCTLEADVPATQSLLFDITGISDKVDRKITLEIIPIYPGALVSDGVDDNAVSDEVIDEPIGGFVLHAEITNAELDTLARYVFLSGIGFSESEPETIGAFYSKSDNKFHVGIPGRSIALSKDNLYTFARTPIATQHSMFLERGGSEYGNAALYQLRLIKSQPTDIQLEAIKWQMLKEHEDYLIQNGWTEIEPDEQ